MLGGLCNWYFAYHWIFGKEGPGHRTSHVGQNPCNVSRLTVLCSQSHKTLPRGAGSTPRCPAGSRTLHSPPETEPFQCFRLYKPEGG